MDLTMRLVIVYAMSEEAKRQAIADIDQSLRQKHWHHLIVVPVTSSAAFGKVCLPLEM
jgi:hypothetical protein